MAVRTAGRQVIAAVVLGGYATTCGLAADGTLGGGSGGSGGSGGPAGAVSPMQAPLANDGGGGTSGPDGRYLSTFTGKATKAVRRVTVTFHDGRVLAAVVGNGMWITVVQIEVGPGGPRIVFGDFEPDEAMKEMGQTVVPAPVVRAYGAGDELLWDERRGDLTCPQGDKKCAYPWP